MHAVPSLLNLRTAVLEPTESYRHRIAVWAPPPDTYPDRLLIITIDHRGKVDHDVYEVREWPAKEINTRRFQLVKASDKTDNVVQIGVNDYCTCPAGSKGHKRECKHQDAMRALFPQSEEAGK